MSFLANKWWWWWWWWWFGFCSIAENPVYVWVCRDMSVVVYWTLQQVVLQQQQTFESDPALSVARAISTHLHWLSCFHSSICCQSFCVEHTRLFIAFFVHVCTIVGYRSAPCRVKWTYWKQIVNAHDFLLQNIISHDKFGQFQSLFVELCEENPGTCRSLEQSLIFVSKCECI